VSIPDKGIPYLSALPDRLQAAVGDTYRIERELGGGGMSRVFLAEETRLGRKVVIKVLPPEMGAGVNVERFEREIQLAAKLQHPHVVPLLTALAEGDLLFYVMPYIEGESLRVKLAREGELPVGEAIRILREVVDALAYAHRNGVVHRDIKPDNVLLSEGHAVVTDFGVAKAVSASSGASSLTSLGVALGTPAYMAPEQAAADPHTDHRADIYAVGALAYEMLSGQPPFTGATPQAVMAMHVTETPEPVTRHRSTVSEGLNALVMRCLEKKAADRWQSAAELVPQLDAFTTPSGGLTPTGTQPAALTSAEIAVQRAHPARVAGLFGLASIGALAVVYSLVQLLGLPYWVVGGAVVLLAAGLPIMLFTGHHERQRALARTTGLQVATPAQGIQRFFTWRRAIIGSALAFAALAVIATGYTAMRLLGVGPVGTLVAAGVIEEGETVILADFEDRSGDSTLAASVTQALRIDLAQSPIVELMDAQSVGEALERMSRQRGSRVDLSLAQEIAEREGVKAIVAGDIGTLGSSYVVSARLISSSDGAELVALRETAASDAELIGAVDRLSAKLRERIGESLRTIRASRPLEQVTTSSLEALRLYTRAEQADSEGDRERALRLFEEAIAIDTTFAMAYRKVAVVLSNAFAEQSRINAAATRAYQYRDRLPPLERYLATAYYFSEVEIDPDRTIDAYRSALEIDPYDDTALNNLAIELMNRRALVEAERLLRRAIATGATYQNYMNLALVMMAQGRWAEAESLLVEFDQRWTGHPAGLLMRVGLKTGQRDYEAAEQLLRPVWDRMKSSPIVAQQLGWGLFAVETVRGRLAAGEAVSVEQTTTFERAGQHGAALQSLLVAAGFDVWFRGDSAEALRKAAAALEQFPLEGIPAEDRPYLDVARIYAQAGRPDLARQLREEWNGAIEASRRSAHDEAGWDQMLALAEQRYDDAVDAARRAYGEVGCNICWLYELARAYDLAGQTDSALAVYERAVTLPDGLALAFEFYSLGFKYRRLGELYEERGERDKAVDYYGRLVELWAGADAEFQPVVQDVQERIARLVGET
jgi:tetratricopeptide (TPR) repeat protein